MARDGPRSGIAVGPSHSSIFGLTTSSCWWGETCARLARRTWRRGRCQLSCCCCRTTYDTSDLVKRDAEHIVLRWQDITHGSPGWAVHQRGGETKGPDGWVVRPVFTETPQYPVDYAVGNHFVATHDRSPFVTRPYIQRRGIDRYDTLDALVGRRNARAGTG